MTGEPTAAQRVRESAWDRLVDPGPPTPPPCTDRGCAANRAALRTAADREEKLRRYAEDVEAGAAGLRRELARLRRKHGEPS